MYFSGFVVAKQPTGCTCRICRNVCNSAGFSIRYVPASQNVSRPRNLGEMWAALSQFCAALGQVSTLIMPLIFQEKSSNTNNDTNTNSNTVQYCCEVF